MTLTQNLKLKTQNLTVDYHCHLLPGLDDGPATIDESIEMARALHQAGYTTVHCTPHLIRGSFEVDNETIRSTLTALQTELARQQINLQLLPGREYYLDEFLIDYLQDPLPLGSTKFLLIEIPSHLPMEFVKESMYRIKGSGYVPMVAHPERCHLLGPKFQDTDRKGVWGSLFNSKLFRPAVWVKSQNSEPADNSLLAYLQEIDCQFQGNIGSFAGLYGERVRLQAERFHAAGLYTHYGSDLHSAGHKDILSIMGP